MAGFYICTGMQLWKGSEYSKIPCMPSFCVSSIAQGSEYACSTFHRVLKKPPVLNIPGLRILQSCEYTKAAKGVEYA